MLALLEGGGWEEVRGREDKCPQVVVEEEASRRNGRHKGRH